MTGEPIGRAPELAAIERVLDEAVGGLSSLLLAVRGTPTPAALDLVVAVPTDRRTHLDLGPLPLAALHSLAAGAASAARSR